MNFFFFEYVYTHIYFLALSTERLSGDAMVGMSTPRLHSLKELESP